MGMNREGAETYLRLLAEAELHGPVLPPARWRSGPGAGTARISRVAQALTSVNAIDPQTAHDIVADFDLALAVREEPGREPMTLTGWTAGPAQVPPGGGPVSRVSRFMRSRPRGGSGYPPIASFAEPGTAEEGTQAGAVRREPRGFTLIGQAVPFHDDVISGELHLLSYACTGAGARFTVAWRMYSSFGPSQLEAEEVEGMCQRFDVTDDRGRRYDLDSTGLNIGSKWTSGIGLLPDPPEDIRWLDITAPGEPAVRVRLDQGGSIAAGAPPPEVTPTAFSLGEYFLILIAERLLSMARDIPRDLRTQAAMPYGPVGSVVFGLGDIIGALEAADVLSPRSPVPGWIATLCASLDIDDAGLTVPPALDLPEHWLSLLAHYQRRKPDTTPVHDGQAAVAAALPEVDGINLAVIGLYNSEGNTWLQAMVWGQGLQSRHGPFGNGRYFPLSIWIRDSVGRWHATRPAGWYGVPGEYTLRLQLTPSLARSTAWIEVLVAGRSAEVRAKLPLRWGYPLWIGRTVHGSTACRNARRASRAARGGTRCAGRPGPSGCPPIPTPRPSSCSRPWAAGRRGAWRWPRPGNGIPTTCPC
jgi:hypothetical protein